MPQSTVQPPPLRQASQSRSGAVLDSSTRRGDVVFVAGQGLCRVLRFSDWGKGLDVEHYIHMKNLSTGKRISFRVHNV